MRRFLVVAFCALVLTAGALGQMMKKEMSKPLGVGDVAPDFTLTDQNGQSVALSAAKGKSPVVLVFYRGYWCPFCRRQLGELRSLLTKGDNALLYAISIDAPAKAKDMATRIAQDGKGEINYPLLSDPNHKTIDAFGIRNPSFDGQEFAGVPHPAVYVVDKNGKIAWARIDEDYRNRPSNEEIRAVLAVLAQGK